MSPVAIALYIHETSQNRKISFLIEKRQYKKREPTDRNCVEISKKHLHILFFSHTICVVFIELMWFLKKNPLYFLICSVVWGCISTSATSLLRTTSGSFNETGLTDIRGDSNSLESSLNDGTIQGDEKLRRRLLDTSASGENNNGDPIRILYTVTTLAEYDKGTRATTKVRTVYN